MIAPESTPIPRRDELEKFISTQRFSTFLSMAQGDSDHAVRLYYDNLKASKEFYVLLHWVEIGLRNRISDRLSAVYGAAWYDNSQLWLGEVERQQIEKARTGLLREGKAIERGRLVAAMHFGLWVNLFNGPYEELWRKCLRRAFNNENQPLERKAIRKELATIHRLRNRIAHYEPIIDQDLGNAKSRIMQFIRWMDADIVRYIR